MESNTSRILNETKDEQPLSQRRPVRPQARDVTLNDISATDNVSSHMAPSRTALAQHFINRVLQPDVTGPSHCQCADTDPLANRWTLDSILLLSQADKTDNQGQGCSNAAEDRSEQTPSRQPSDSIKTCWEIIGPGAAFKGASPLIIKHSQRKYPG